MYPSWRILKIQLLQLLHCKINHHWATPWWKIGKTNRGRQQHLEWPKLWCQGSCTIATSISRPIGLMKEKCFANPFQNEWEVGARRTVTRVENVVWGHSSTSSSAADAKQTRLNTYDIHVNHKNIIWIYYDIHIMGILFNRPWLWSSAILIRFHKTKFRQKCTICSKHVFNMSRTV